MSVNLDQAHVFARSLIAVRSPRSLAERGPPARTFTLTHTVAVQVKVVDQVQVNVNVNVYGQRA